MTELLPDDGDERRLRALFDASAEDASGALLTRLRARAADVPAHVRRRPAFIPRWAWAPAFAGLGVAGITALAAAFSLNWGNSDGGSAAAPPAAVNAVIPRAEAAPRPTAATEENEELADEALDYSPGEDWQADARVELELDPLDGLAAEDDLDAWLFATDELARGGG